MGYYIEAYDANGKMILGNLDGQDALGPRMKPTLCAAWKYLKSEHRPNWYRVAYWRLVDEKDNEIATYLNQKNFLTR